MIDRLCLVKFPSALRHRAECDHAEADNDEETAFNNFFNPEAGYRAGPGLRVQLMPRRRPALYIAWSRLPPRGREGRKEIVEGTASGIARIITKSPVVFGGSF